MVNFSSPCREWSLGGFCWVFLWNSLVFGWCCETWCVACEWIYCAAIKYVNFFFISSYPYFCRWITCYVLLLSSGDAVLLYSLWCRKRLFNMINDLPTIFEVVTGAAKKQSKEKAAVSNHSSNKSKSNSKVV